MIKSTKVEEKSNLKKGIMTVIALTCIKNVTSPIWTMGVINIYFLSYLHYYQSFITKQYQYFFNFILYSSFYFFAPLSAFLDKKIGPQKVILLEGILLIISSIIFYISKNIFIYYFSMLIVGIAGTIGASIITKHTAVYFPKKKGLINSIGETIGALGSSLTTFFSEKIINYNSVSVYKDDDGKVKNKEDIGFYPKDIASNILKFFILQFFLYFIFISLTLIFFYPIKNFNIDINKDSKLKEDIENISNEKLLSNDGELENQDFIKENDNNDNELETINDNEKRKKIKTKILKSNRIIKLMIISLFSNFTLKVVFNSYRQLVTEFDITNIEEKYSQFIGNVAFFCVCINCLIFGTIVDKYSYKFLSSIITLTGIFVGFFYSFSFNNNYLFVIFTLLITIINGGNLVVLSTHIMKCFPIDYYIEIESFLKVPGGISNLVISPFIVLMTSIFSNKLLGYILMYGFGGLLAFIAFILVLTEGENSFKV